MELQSGSQLDAVQPSMHKDPPILPLIPHVTPIWPSDKRLDNSKARRKNFRRVLKNRIILVRFLRNLNPAAKVEFLPDVGAKDTEDASNIVLLTKRFLEERKEKLKRVHQIQMEAFLREEKSKTLRNKLREYQYGWETKTDRRKKETLNPAMADELSKELNRKNEADKFRMKIHPVRYELPVSRTRKETRKTYNDQNVNIRFSSIYSHRSDAVPYNCQKPTDDPRFQRLISVLVPFLKEGSRAEKSQDNREGQTRRTTKVLLVDEEKANTCERETMTPKINEKNVQR